MKTKPVAHAEAANRTTALCLTALVIGLTATFLVYRPDRVLPFDFVDFSEFLPLLKRASFVERVDALFGYYLREQGRANIVAYVALAAKWELFGDYSPAWQWIRFATMWAVIIIAYRLLRRIECPPLPSMAGASVFLFAPPAVDGWTRLTMAEPVGTVLMLIAALLALKPLGRRNDHAVWIGFAIICVLIVLLKEMMVVVLLLPLALVSALPARILGFHRGRRLRALILAGAVAVPIAAIPVVMSLMNAQSDAYSADFGTRLRPITDVFAQWSLGILPFGPGSSFPPSMAGFALLLVTALLVTGWTWRLRATSADRDNLRMLLVVAVVFPFIGAATYLPWPSYNRFYAIPFLMGGALLVSGALSEAESRSKHFAAGAYAIWALFLIFAGADASNQATRMAQRQKINRDVVAQISAMTTNGADTVFLATEQHPPTFWQGIGPTLHRYGAALGYRMPPIINAGCDEARRLADTGHQAVLFYSSLCPTRKTGIAFSAPFRVLRLPSLRTVADSIRVDLVIPTASDQSH